MSVSFSCGMTGSSGRNFNRCPVAGVGAASTLVFFILLAGTKTQTAKAIEPDALDEHKNFRKNDDAASSLLSTKGSEDGPPAAAATRDHAEKTNSETRQNVSGHGEKQSRSSADNKKPVAFHLSEDAKNLRSELLTADSDSISVSELSHGHHDEMNQEDIKALVSPAPVSWLQHLLPSWLTADERTSNQPAAFARRARSSSSKRGNLRGSQIKGDTQVPKSRGDVDDVPGPASKLGRPRPASGSSTNFLREADEDVIKEEESSLGEGTTTQKLPSSSDQVAATFFEKDPHVLTGSESGQVAAVPREEEADAIPPPGAALLERCDSCSVSTPASSSRILQPQQPPAAASPTILPAARGVPLPAAAPVMSTQSRSGGAGALPPGSVGAGGAPMTGASAATTATTSTLAASATPVASTLSGAGAPIVPQAEELGSAGPPTSVEPPPPSNDLFYTLREEYARDFVPGEVLHLPALLHEDVKLLPNGGVDHEGCDFVWLKGKETKLPPREESNEAHPDVGDGEEEKAKWSPKVLLYFRDRNFSIWNAPGADDDDHDRRHGLQGMANQLAFDITSKGEFDFLAPVCGEAKKNDEAFGTGQDAETILKAFGLWSATRAAPRGETPRTVILAADEGGKNVFPNFLGGKNGEDAPEKHTKNVAQLSGLITISAVGVEKLMGDESAMKNIPALHIQGKRDGERDLRWFNAYARVMEHRDVETLKKETMYKGKGKLYTHKKFETVMHYLVPNGGHWPHAQKADETNRLSNTQCEEVAKDTRDTIVGFLLHYFENYDEE
ncbi:unnamed protein product [Amoebophrya sp. A120]|nr:unnamed protein product [Amoebophrya sp. A120]|eukprot:GSA120T00014047001.1